MKFLILALFLFPSVIFADYGMSMSYRSIPAYAKGDDGITHFRTIETGMLSFYLDDTLKGHSKTKGGYYVTKFFVPKLCFWKLRKKSRYLWRRSAYWKKIVYHSASISYIW